MNVEYFVIYKNNYRYGNFHILKSFPKKTVEKSLKNVEKYAIL